MMQKGKMLWKIKFPIVCIHSILHKNVHANTQRGNTKMSYLFYILINIISFIITAKFSRKQQHNFFPANNGKYKAKAMEHNGYK